MNIIFFTSIILSLLHSILFWDRKPGISVFIFTLATVGYLIYVLYKKNRIINRYGLLFSIPIVLLSSTYFIFNNELFSIINGLVIIALFIVMCIYTCKPRLKLPNFIYEFISVILGTLESIGDIIKEIKSLKRDKAGNSNTFKIIKAIVISIPIILIVLALLMSADQVFEKAFRWIFDFIIDISAVDGLFTTILRIGLMIVIFLIIGGFLVNVVEENTMFNDNAKENNNEEKNKKSFDFLTANMIFTILNIIYAIFSIIQFSTLFTHSANITNFNYSEYARQGFFQLMFVSFINFGLLMIFNINKVADGEKKLYTKVMEIAMIVFTIVIIISAFYRMYLYEQTYGYTYLRIFVYFILFTELVLTIPVIMYISGKDLNLLKIAITTCTIMYVILNFINIDNLIAKKNIDMYFESGDLTKFDLSYIITNTNTDAISQIKRLEKAKDQIIVDRVESYLKDKKSILSDEEMKWQEMNLSKLFALSIL